MNFPVNYERQNMTIMKRSIVWLAICFGFSIGFATTVLAQQDADSLRQKFQQNLAKAQQGDSNAQTSVGYAYDTGKGVSKDETQAAIWYRKAADQGHAKSQHNLAYMYDFGRGIEKDHAVAAKWYRKAAEQGHAASQARLGTFCEYGFGVDIDLAEAVKWFRKAAEQDNVDGMRHLTNFYSSHGSGKNALVDAVEAKRWGLRQAQLEGDLAVARFYKFEQQYSKPDPKEAFKWFLKAAAKGDPKAQHEVALAYESGSGVAKDLKQAHRWRLKAAAQGYFDAVRKLGFVYEEGLGVEKNLEEAVAWHHKASLAGSVENWAALVRIDAADSNGGIGDIDLEALYESLVQQVLNGNLGPVDFWTYGTRGTVGRKSYLSRKLASLGFPEKSAKLIEEIEAKAKSETCSSDVKLAACKCLLALAEEGATDYYSVARPTLEKQLRIDEAKASNANNLDFAPLSYIETLAEVYRHLSETNREEELLRKWLNIVQNKSTANDSQKHSELQLESWLRDFLVTHGEPLDASQFLERRFQESRKKWRKNEHLSYLLGDCDDLVSVYISLGRAPEAVAILKTAFEHLGLPVSGTNWENKLAAQAPHFASFKFAEVLRRAGSLRQSKRILEAILADQEKPDIHMLRGLAVTLDDLGETELALSRFRESEPNPYLSLPGSFRCAKLMLQSGDSAAAYAVVQKRIVDHEQIMRARKPSESSSTVYSGLLNYSYETLFSPEGLLTDFYVADNKIKKAIEYQDEQLRKSTGYTQERLAFLTEARRNKYLSDQYHPLLMKSLALGLRSPDDEQITTMAAGWLLNGKSIAHEVLAESSLNSSKEAAPKIAELKRVRATLAAATLMDDSLPNKKAVVDKYQQQQSKIESELTYERMLRRGGKPWIEVDTVRAAIPDDSRLVNLAKVTPYDFKQSFETGKPVWLKPRYVAWFIPPAGTEAVRCVDLGDASAIDSLVQQVRNEMIATPGKLGTAGELASEQTLQVLLKQLGALIYEPLTAHLGDANELIVSPDGELWTIPWEILRTDEQYLVEQMQIRYVTSGRELVQNNASNPELQSPAIFAAPDYDLSTNQLALIEPTERNMLALRSNNQLKFSSLPYSRIEAQMISPAIKEYANRPAVQRLGSQAKESTFKQLKKPQVLVVSTHGYFDSNKKVSNPLLRCGLALAGANNRPAAGSAVKEDGILTGLEIVSTDLRGTELVVLSACETGLGDIRNGEGVAGLRQAFQLAGAESVLASLWQVEDGETARLMKLFFENLSEGKSKSEALRQAQLTRIKARRARHGAAHPFFWAAFTLTGQD